MEFHIITQVLFAEIHSFIHFVFDSYNSVSASGHWPQVNFCLSYQNILQVMMAGSV